MSTERGESSRVNGTRGDLDTRAQPRALIEGRPDVSAQSGEATDESRDGSPAGSCRKRPTRADMCTMT